MNNKCAVVIEHYDEGGCGAYVPDLPGCVAAASSRQEIERLIAEVIGLHIEALLEQGNAVPLPSSAVEYIQPSAVAYEDARKQLSVVGATGIEPVTLSLEG